ncbi:MAG TPA: 50S ribosomal protein L3 [Candidatus Paceibacterota bacterium]|jgi:large subunit ribosomal protein L3|nr:large subunit ribosomal protein [Patescibacteria group bacterium]
MKFLLGTKSHMTQVFTEDGKVIAGTVIIAGPVTVTQVKNEAKDGYKAIQVGFGEKKLNRLSKAVRGHIKTVLPKENTGFKVLRESTAVDLGDVKLGDTMNVSIFNPGDTVTISSISKGKGFQGVVKRHNFKGGPRTHGQKHSEREPGSIGAGGMQRVFKGMRMAGRMGSDRVTVKKVPIVKIDAENNLLFVKGPIAGRRGTLVEIKTI